MHAARGRFREDEFRVGGIFPLTGYLSGCGEYKRKAADLKIEMINEMGGIHGHPLRLIVYDDQSSPEQAARIAEALVLKHRVIAMVGTGSLPVSSAVAGVANKYRIPAFLNSGYAIDPVKDLFVFNTAHKTEFAVACSFQHFLERGINRVGLLMPKGPLGELGSCLGRRLANRLGIRIVGEERFDLTSRDVTSQLVRLSALRPLAVFSFVTGEPAAGIAKRMGEMGLAIPLLVSHGNANPAFLKLVSRTPVPILVPSGKTMALDSIPEGDPCKPIAARFNQRHLQRYGEPANYYSAELADAIDLMAEGLRNAGADPEGLRDAVECIQKFEGMQGVYDLSPIDHYGTGLEHMILLTIKEGRWHFTKAFSPTAVLDDLHTNEKRRLICWLADLLSNPGPDFSMKSDVAPIARNGPVIDGNGLNDGDPKHDLYFVARLHFQQKREMMRAIREDDYLKARECLYRLLNINLSQHLETFESFKVTVLELFLAVFDTAAEAGIDLEELVRLKCGLTVEWETVKDHETLCLWIIRVLNKTMAAVAHVRQQRDLLLKRVYRFLEANYADNLTVDRIAREVCLSPSRLIHRMKSQFGLTLGDCIRQVRVDRAKVLLKNTDMPISSIAHDVGFRDQSYFTKAFKKHANCTPKEFRECPVKSPPFTENRTSGQDAGLADDLAFFYQKSTI
jgi:branched-chain amino acid transport system substrate-binding protein